MAVPTTGREFIDLLKSSQLLEASLLDKVVAQLEKHADAEPTRLAVTLIKNQLITEFHARQLMSGRYKGFYLGKFKLLELVGAGGMGKVFLAEQITMERLVAIKLIGKLPAKDRQKEVLARFAREARAVAALRHPNIIHAYDFDTADNVPYIVMEYVEGIDTAHIVGKFGPLPISQACEYIKQAAAGLYHAHQAGMVHRDIKPGNLLVDAEGQVKILDLGLCSAFETESNDSLTVDQDQLGTVDYIAPEQALDSHKVDGRADIYSLGATFYGLVTGQPLFPGKSTAQKLLLHQTTDPVPVEELRKDIPPEVAAIIKKMLAKKPEDRFANANELEQALVPFAVSKVPPYDLSAIKYHRSAYEPYLRKSPDPSEISVQALSPEIGLAREESPSRASSASPSPTPTSARSTTSATSASGASKKSGSSKGTRGPSSMISMKTPDALAKKMDLDEAYTELALPEIPVRRRRKHSSKKEESAGNPMAMVLGGLLFVVALFSGVMYWLVAPKSSAVSPVATVTTQKTAVPTPNTPDPAPAKDKPATVTTDAPQIVELKNGDFGQTSDIPAFWDWHQFDTGYPQKISRDLKEYQLKTGSLRVDTGAKAIKGLVGQQLFGGAGKKLTIKGLLKTSGNVRAAAIIRRLNDEERSMGRQPLKEIGPDTEWTPFEKSLELPGDTQSFVIGLEVDGQGTAWIDEVSLVGDGFKTNNEIFLNDKYEQMEAVHSPIAKRPRSRGVFPLTEPVPADNVIKNMSHSQRKGTMRVQGGATGKGRWEQKKALNFEGGNANQYGELSKDLSDMLNSQKPFSISLWVFANKFDYWWQTIASKGDHSWRFYRESGEKSNPKNMVFHVGDKSQAEKKKVPVAEVIAKKQIDTGKWFHLVGTFDVKEDKATLKLYLNGEQVGSTEGYKPKESKTPVWIGANGDPVLKENEEYRTWNGRIDEFAAWKRVLTDDEVKELYRRGQP